MIFMGYFKFGTDCPVTVFNMAVELCQEPKVQVVLIEVTFPEINIQAVHVGNEVKVLLVELRGQKLSELGRLICTATIYSVSKPMADHLII